MIANYITKGGSRFQRLVLALSLSLTASAEIRVPPGSTDISSLFNRSEGVYLVKLTTANQLQSADRTSLHVEVVRTYKGAQKSQVALKAGGELIEALRAQGNEQKFFVFLEPGSAEPVLSQQNVFLTRGVLSHDESLGMVQIEHDSANSLDGSQRDVEDLHFLLDFASFDTFSEEALERDSRVKSLPVRLLSLAVLMGTHKVKYISEVLLTLQTNAEQIPTDEAIIVAGQIEKYSTYIPTKTLNDFSLVQVLPIQMDSMQAVRNRGSTESIPTLIAHLDDTQSITQGMAVASLAEIVPQAGLPNPTGPEFDKNPFLYTSAWKKWWEKEGRKLYGQPTA